MSGLPDMGGTHPLHSPAEPRNPLSSFRHSPVEIPVKRKTYNSFFFSNIQLPKITLPSAIIKKDKCEARPCAGLSSLRPSIHNPNSRRLDRSRGAPDERTCSLGCKAA